MLEIPAAAAAAAFLLTSAATGRLLLLAAVHRSIDGDLLLQHASVTHVLDNST